MKQTLRPISFVTLLATLFVLGLVPDLRAQEGCTNASVEGSYAYFGTDLTDLVGVPTAHVGYNTLDGKGEISTLDWAAFNGNPTEVRQTGTYEVNEDCTGILSVSPDGIVFNTFDFLILDGGNELRSIGRDPRGLILSYKKMASQKCATDSFAGSYGYNGAGRAITGGNPGLINFMGRMVSDGAGHFSGSDIVVRNGQRRERTYEAEYTVNSDCTGSYEADTSLGPPPLYHFRFVIAGDMLFVIVSDPGWVLAFTAKRQ